MFSVVVLLPKAKAPKLACSLGFGDSDFFAPNAKPLTFSGFGLVAAGLAPKLNKELAGTSDVGVDVSAGLDEPNTKPVVVAGFSAAVVAPKLKPPVDGLSAEEPLLDLSPKENPPDIGAVSVLAAPNVKPEN